MSERADAPAGLRWLIVPVVLYGVECAIGAAGLVYGAAHEHVDAGEVVFFGGWGLAATAWWGSSFALWRGATKGRRFARALGILRAILALPAMLGAGLGIAFLVMLAAGPPMAVASSTPVEDLFMFALVTLPLTVLIAEVATMVGVFRWLPSR